MLQRRLDQRQLQRSLVDRVEARTRGSHRARLQHPQIDLTRCFGCGACVRACPEKGVLALLHGQCAIVHGARCVGHGLCAQACPTNAIALTLGDLSDRRDLPALSEQLEAVGVPGLFLAGEIGGFALVRTAVTQGVAVADAVARHCSEKNSARGAIAGGDEQPLDLLIVGAGPGGMACSLRAKERGLRFVTIDQESRLGGTVAAYPRRKMVMTQPVELPLHGKLPRLTYQKEELVDLWDSVAAKHQLPIRLGVQLIGIERDEAAGFKVQTNEGVILARHVCLALGRRGTPRRLNVPGEDLAKVSYSLLDAESYHDRRILIVGGGDSAVEAALGLADQAGNSVTISYRKGAFFRLKARNERLIQEAIESKRVRALFNSEVTAIEPDSVRLRLGNNGQSTQQTLPNDEVFIFAGGDPPFALLEKAGVSFDPQASALTQTVDRGSGLLAALLAVFLNATVLLGWAIWFRGYYSLGAGARAGSDLHDLLRPVSSIGLSFAVLACGLFLWNLAYLIRRSVRLGRWMPGTLQFWMGTHVFTGLFGFLCVLLHAGFTTRDTVGGYAFFALAVVVITGVIGRYLYAFVPRAANGREMDLDELRGQLAALSGKWDRGGRDLGRRVREEIEHLIDIGRWQPSLYGRLSAMIRGQVRLRRSLDHLRRHGESDGMSREEVREALELMRRAYRLTLWVTHYEEVRAVLASWRYLHRWLALLMVWLTVTHLLTAVRYAQIDWSVLPLIGGFNR